jgi:hypothetical protein
MRRSLWTQLSYYPLSEKLHEAYKAVRPEAKLAQVAAFKVKQLQPTELLSTASYQPGEMIEY